MKNWLCGMALMVSPLFCYGHDLLSVGECDGFLEHLLNEKQSWSDPQPLRGRYPSLTPDMARIVKPFLLPSRHPIRPVLDRIFSKTRVIENDQTLQAAGFTILFSQKRSRIRVVHHPRLKGYLLKVYPDSEQAVLDSGWKRLAIRCIIAQKIKAIIARKKIKNFVVADKWLYRLPTPHTVQPHQQPVLLVVKNMNIYDQKASKEAWRTKPTRKVVRELYAILRHGYGSSKLHANLPYTRSGKFAFIDTEYEKRPISFSHARLFLPPSMRPYWDSLVKKEGGRVLPASN